MARANLVRARIGRIEKNLGRAYAENVDGVEVLDEPVRNQDGSLRPVTRLGGRPLLPRTSVDEEAGANYSGKRVAWLQGEIDSRNAARDSDLIEVEGKGTKSDLIAALAADDVRQGTTTTTKGSDQ